MVLLDREGGYDDEKRKGGDTRMKSVSCTRMRGCA